MMRSMKNDLTIRQVCERENVSRQTVHRWLDKGLRSRLIRVRGFQQERRISVSDLDDWMTGGAE